MRYLSTDRAARLKISTPTITEVTNPSRTRVPPPSCLVLETGAEEDAGEGEQSPQVSHAQAEEQHGAGLRPHQDQHLVRSWWSSPGPAAAGGLQPRPQGRPC